MVGVPFGFWVRSLVPYEVPARVGERVLVGVHSREQTLNGIEGARTDAAAVGVKEMHERRCRDGCDRRRSWRAASRQRSTSVADRTLPVAIFESRNPDTSHHGCRAQARARSASIGIPFHHHATSRNPDGPQRCCGRRALLVRRHGYAKDQRLFGVVLLPPPPVLRASSAASRRLV